MRPNIIALGLLVATVFFGLYLLASGGRAPKPGALAPAAPMTAGERPIPPLPPGVSVRPPRFDILRIDPAGGGAAQGRAEPLARVTLKTEAGQSLGEGSADERGEWVILITAALPPGDHCLQLVAEMPDGRGVQSPEQAVVALPQKPEGHPLVVLMSPDAASEVLQSPEGPETRSLCLEAVDQDEAGALRLGGRADPGHGLRVYADDHFLAQTQSDDEGRWQLALTAGALGPGAHRIRLDVLREDGTVGRRLEAPFEGLATSTGKPVKAEAAPPAASIESDGDVWRITRRDGRLAERQTVIYGQGAGTLLDPARVYPGQVPPPVAANPPAGIVPAADR